MPVAVNRVKCYPTLERWTRKIDPAYSDAQRAQQYLYTGDDRIDKSSWKGETNIKIYKYNPMSNIVAEFIFFCLIVRFLSKLRD